MKSIKLASGFAVSALALAIAGQAAAEATVDVEFAGEIEVRTVFDLENDTRKNTMPGFSSAEDEYSFYGVWSVTHGPFSGDLLIGIEEDEKAGGSEYTHQAGNAGNGYVLVDNLRVDEGPISFGQIGSAVNTAGLMEALTDYAIFSAFDVLGGDLEEMDISYDVEAAFRYTVEEFGLAVQAEGDTEDDFGIAAALTQDLDVATVWADFQYRETPTGGDDDGETFLGFGVEATPVDMLTLTAVLNQRSSSPFAAAESQTALALKAAVQATDEVSVFFSWIDVDLGDDVFGDETDFVVAGLTAEFAPITYELVYQAWVEDIAEGLVENKVSYADGPWGAFVEANFGLGGGDTAVNDYMEFVVGGSYTTASNIIFGSEFTMVDFSEGSTGSVGEDADAQTVEFFANYSF